MTRRRVTLALFLSSFAIAAGCGGDVSTMISSNPQIRDKVMTVFAGNRGLADQMVARFLAADSTRTLMVDKLLGDSTAANALLARVAGNRELLGNTLRMAARDSVMKDYILTLFEGIQLGATPAKH